MKQCVHMVIGLQNGPHAVVSDAFQNFLHVLFCDDFMGKGDFWGGVDEINV